MKGLVKIQQVLVSLFLILVATSTIFLSSPAIADTSDSVGSLSDYFKLRWSDNIIPVVIVTQGKEPLSTYREKIKPEAVKIFGDKYRVFSGNCKDLPEELFLNPGSSASLYCDENQPFFEGYIAAGKIVAPLEPNLNEAQIIGELQAVRRLLDKDS